MERFWERFKCFIFVSIVYIINNLNISLSENSVEEGSFLCRNCGESVANIKNIQEIPSKLAHANWNKTVQNKYKVFIQLFENPNDQKFKVITFNTSFAKAHETAIIDASWFPGFAWRISVCPRCGFHLGWKFQPVNFNHITHSEKDTFFGLILDNLLQESDSNSLLIEPKWLQS